ncbi:MAG: glycoside hydrolase family 15 protein [Thermoplasmata archaeon]|nr:glycoside hydrolase family 15 protein [Thermoplasmata archaeon]
MARPSRAPRGSAPRPRGGGRARRPPIPVPTTTHDYGVIGNLRTAALVHRCGAIDWACLPRFSDPSVFARLLDDRRGGTFVLRPMETPDGVQRYRPATNILETVFHPPGADAVVTVVDFMPIAEGASDEEAARIVRLVTAEGGPAELDLWFEPRFDYGRQAAELALGPGGVTAASGETALALRGPAVFALDGGVATARLSLPADATIAFDLSWGAAPRRGAGVRALLTETERFWTGWTHGPGAPLHRLANRWHAAVERSELVLKLLSHVTTGAFVAAPTTSLPEWPGGRRNWDYRYVWIRDSAFVAQELLLLGHVAEARAFLGWVLERLGPARKGRRRELRVLYGSHGEPELTERTLPHLAGFLRSRPVRVGNAANDQFQLDIYGELLDAANLLAEIDPTAVSRPTLRALLDVADDVARRWMTPDQGIWEVRGPARHFVHSKLMAWVALDRAVRIADRFGGDRRTRRWRTTAETIREAIVTRGWDAKSASFVRAFGETAIDAANLRIPIVGFLPFDDPRVLSTVARIERELARGPFVWRYKVHDGVGGREGSFLPCGLWLVECQARAGSVRKAREGFEALLRTASPLGLFAEEWDPEQQRPLGNFPQAFTHVGVLRAALALGLAMATPARRAEVALSAPYLPGITDLVGASSVART